MATMVRPDVTEAPSEAEKSTLRVAVEALRVDPRYNDPPEKLEKALEAILENRVTATPTPGVYAVASRQLAEGSYETQDGRCTCPWAQAHPGGRDGCYHTAAAALYAVWQAAYPPAPGESPVAPLDPPLRAQEVSLPAPTLVIPVEAPRMPQAPRSPTPTPLTPSPTLALPLRSISAIIADLSKPLPKACLATRVQGGQTIMYLHWQTVVRLLDTYAPGWSGCITEVLIIPGSEAGKTGDKVMVRYALTIPAAEGLIVREATGQEDVEMVEEYTDTRTGETKTRRAYGDSTSNAEAMAFKRAAAKFGAGLDLYDKDGTGEAWQTHLRDEVVAALAELGKVVDEVRLARGAVIHWLRGQTGACSNATIPLAAIQALRMHLQGGTGVPAPEKDVP